MTIYNNWISEDFKRGIVSVIVPTYNRQELLQEAIHSVIAQTYRPIECIIVDDGSTDGTNNIVNEFNSKLNDDDFTLKYFYQQNAGAQVARNTGTLASNGEFIQYLDSDDLLYPEKINLQVKYLRENPASDGVFGNWRTGDTKKNEIVKAYESEDMIAQMLTGRCIHTLSFLMRRGLVEKIGPWDITLKRNQEIDYHLMGLLKGAKYCYLDQETGLHRKHDLTSITSSTGLEEIHQFYLKWEKLLEEHNKFSQEMKIKFANMYLWVWGTHTHNAPGSVNLLTDVMRLHPNAPLFSSKKLIAVKWLLGKKLALKLWFSWLLFNNKKVDGT
ncbi:MAG: glycosyltransferase family 2 protein [Ginsengibacter sp.]